MKGKYKTITVHVDCGSYDMPFMFEIGDIARKYPSLLHVYFHKVSSGLRKCKLLIPINEK